MCLWLYFLCRPKNCSYSEGKWVFSPGYARRYNGTLCNVKESHDCIRNGRPDTGYLDWRWQPAGCRLPAFNPRAFLSQLRGKHLAFVGDSMARNQVQSMVCLLSAAYPVRIVYRDRNPYKYYFWRWSFPTHDVTVSFYWAPFIAHATGKASNDSVAQQQMNYVDLDALDDRWAADADTMDVVVFSIGHWLLNGAIYYNGTEMVGAHNHPELGNTTVLGYALPMRVAYRKAFDRLMSSGAVRQRNVVLATFSPAHFEGSTFTTACPRKEPFKEGEKKMRPIEEELRAIMYEEAEAAVRKSAEGGGAMTVDVLDITQLAILRPDGHPGPYMHRDPFAHGVQEWMSADCLHFCLPGPVDTFNEILQQMLRKKR
jgi:xyloglucan O-acetyltransferase